MTRKFAPLAKLFVGAALISACVGCASNRQPVAASPTVSQSPPAHSPYTSYTASGKPADTVAVPEVVVAGGQSATSLSDAEPMTSSYAGTRSRVASSEDERPFFRPSECSTPGCGSCKR